MLIVPLSFSRLYDKPLKRLYVLNSEIDYKIMSSTFLFEISAEFSVKLRKPFNFDLIINVSEFRLAMFSFKKDFLSVLKKNITWTNYTFNGT